QRGNAERGRDEQEAKTGESHPRSTSLPGVDARASRGLELPVHVCDLLSSYGVYAARSSAPARSEPVTRHCSSSPRGSVVSRGVVGCAASSAWKTSSSASSCVS